MKCLCLILSLLLPQLCLAAADPPLSKTIDKFEGLNTFNDSTRIGDFEAQDLQNVITDHGYLEKRGGSYKKSAIVAGQAGRFIGEFISLSNTHYLIAQAGNSIYYSTDDGVTWTFLKTIADGVLSMVPAFGKAWFFDGFDVPFSWDTLVVTSETTIPICKYAVFADERLYCANAAGYPSTLYASRYGDATDWTIPTTIPMAADSPNSFSFNQNDGEQITCLAVTPWGKFVAKKHSSFMLKGQDNDGYYKQTISPNIGCVDNRTVQMVDGVLMWASEEGVYGYAGGSGGPIYLSQAIEPLYKTIQQNYSESTYWLNTAATDWGWSSTYNSTNTWDWSSSSGDLLPVGASLPINTTDFSQGTISPSGSFWKYDGPIISTFSTTRDNRTGGFDVYTSTSNLDFTSDYITLLSSNTFDDPGMDISGSGSPWKISGNASYGGGYIELTAAAGHFDIRVCPGDFAVAGCDNPICTDISYGTSGTCTQAQMTAAGMALGDTISLVFRANNEAGENAGRVWQARTWLGDDVSWNYSINHVEGDYIVNASSGSSPGAAITGFYESDAIDSASDNNVWRQFYSTDTLPSGSTIAYTVQTSSDSTCDDCWTGYQTVTNGGEIYLAVSTKRYLRYKMTLTRTNENLPGVVMIKTNSAYSGDYISSVTAFGYIPSTIGPLVPTANVTGVSYFVRTCSSPELCTGAWVAVTPSAVFPATITPRKYIQFKASYAGQSIDMNSAMLANVKIYSTVRGSWVSAVHNIGTGITSWGLLTVNSSDTANAALYYIRGQNTSFAADAATPTWYAITSYSFPSISTSTYVQLKVDDTAISDVSNYKLSALTLNWNEGESYPMASLFYDHRYFLSVNLSTITFYNDTALVFQKNKTWTKFNGKSWNALTLYDFVPYAVAGSTDSSVYTIMQSTYTDAGTAINAYWTSKDFDYGIPNQQKVMQKFWFAGGNYPNLLVNFDYSIDKITNWSGSGYIRNTGESEDTTGSVIAPVPLFDSFALGKYFRFKLSNSAVGDPLKIDSYTVYYGVKPLSVDRWPNN